MTQCLKTYIHRKKKSIDIQVLINIDIQADIHIKKIH